MTFSKTSNYTIHICSFRESLVEHRPSPFQVKSVVIFAPVMTLWSRCSRRGTRFSAGKGGKLSAIVNPLFNCSQTVHHTLVPEIWWKTCNQPIPGRPQQMSEQLAHLQSVAWSNSSFIYSNPDGPACEIFLKNWIGFAKVMTICWIEWNQEITD